MYVRMPAAADNQRRLGICKRIDTIIIDVCPKIRNVIFTFLKL